MTIFTLILSKRCKLNKNQRKLEERLLEAKQDRKEIKKQLEVANQKHDIVLNQLSTIQDKLNIVLSDRVVKQYINEYQDASFVVLRDTRDSEVYNYYITRTRNDCIKNVKKKQMKKYKLKNKNLEVFYTSKNSPNPRIYWLSFKKLNQKFIEKDPLSPLRQAIIAKISGF